MRRGLEVFVIMVTVPLELTELLLELLATEEMLAGRMPCYRLVHIGESAIIK